MVGKKRGKGGRGGGTWACNLMGERTLKTQSMVRKKEEKGGGEFGMLGGGGGGGGGGFLGWFEKKGEGKKECIAGVSDLYLNRKQKGGGEVVSLAIVKTRENGSSATIRGKKEKEGGGNECFCPQFWPR